MLTRILFVLLITLLSTLGSASTWAAQSVLVVLDQDLQKLSQMECYLAWKTRLKAEGYAIEEKSVEHVKSAAATLEWTQDRPDIAGVILIGDLQLPAIRIPINRMDVDNDAKFIAKLKLGQVKVDWTGDTQVAYSFLPLMSDLRLDEASIKRPETFRSLRRWVGLISDGTGKKGESTERLNRYCRYFQRNLEYRDCQPSDSIKSASYVAFDWKSAKSYFQFSTSNATEYRSLKKLLESSSMKESPVTDFATLAAHSSSTNHEGSLLPFVGVRRSTVRKINPRIRFYNLYACHSGDKVGDTNLAENYLMHTDETLGVYAPTTSGGFRLMRVAALYAALKQGASFGDALVRYLKEDLANPRYPSDFEASLSYEGGMLFYGDPTLTLHGCT
jgi:hypothetical protein